MSKVRLHLLRSVLMRLRPVGASVLTTTPNAMLAPIHNRMPVIIEAPGVEERLARGGDAFLRPAPDDALAKAAATPAMNRIGFEGPECLQAPPRAPVG